MRTTNQKWAHACSKAARIAVACIVALGLVPVGALAAPGESEGNDRILDGVASADSAEGEDAHSAGVFSKNAAESLEQQNCVIAKTSDASVLSDEPVVGVLDDAVLLSYETSEEAQDAVERLARACEFAEVDAPVMAAAPGSSGAGEVEAAEKRAAADGPFAVIDDVAVRGNLEKSAEGEADRSGSDGNQTSCQVEADESAVEPDVQHASGKTAESGEALGALDSRDAADAGETRQSNVDSSAGGTHAQNATADEAPKNAIHSEAIEKEKSTTANTPNTVQKTTHQMEAIHKKADENESRVQVFQDAVNAAAAAAGAIGDAKARRGDRVLVALVDSGAPEGADVAKAVSVIGDDPSDACGHAAQMYDIIRAQAPDADIMTVRVLDEAGHGTIAALYAGIKAAMAEGADIINLSVYTGLSDDSQAISSVVKEARDAGMVVIAAAGNAGKDASGYVPANAEGAVTAGACDEQGIRKASSNFGDVVDVYVPCEATSVAAAMVSGWLAANGSLDDPFASLERACSDGVFFDEAGEPALAEIDAPADMEYDAVMPAMAINEPTKTELRNNAARSESAVPAQTIVLDNGGVLPLAEAELSGTVAGLERGTHLISAGPIVNRETFGVWIANPGTSEADAYERDVDGVITLKWKDVGADADGNRLDLTLDVSNIKIRTNDPLAHDASSSNASKRILLFRNNNYTDGSGVLNLSSRMEAVNGANSRMGVCMTVHATFHLTGQPTSAKANGTYLFMSSDLDQPDCSLWPVADHVYTGKYTESMQLVSGFDAQTYLQEDIPAGSSSPDPGSSLLRINTATGRFSGMEPNDYPDEFREGFVAATSGAEFAVNWYGSNCDTTLLSDYEGVVIRDKNDPTNDTTDKAVITKTTNAFGQAASDEAAAFDEESNHGGKRTSTSWRSTSMPWKGSGTYHFSALPGYRVTKVKVLYKKWDTNTESEVPMTDVYEGNDLRGLTELTFGGSDADYPVVRDYDIIVTTARVADAAVTLKAKKILQGRSLREGEFSFELRDGGKKIGEATNAADGTVTFLPVSYKYSDKETYPMKHTYTIVEIPGNVAAVTYDTASYDVDVTVSYDSKAGILKAVPDYAKSPVFTNVFSLHGGVRVKKTDASTEAGVAGAEFTVKTADGEKSYTMTSGDGGIAELDASTLPKGSYVMSETKAPKGYLLNKSWSKTFEITKDGEVIDLTAEPCPDEPDSVVGLPKTGGGGVTWVLAAAVAAVAAGIIVRRRLVKA